MEICEKFCILRTNLSFFYPKKSKTLGSLCDEFVTFDQKLIEPHGIFVWQSKLFRANWVRSEHKKGVLRALHSIPLNMGVPHGFISWITILILLNIYLVISMFATLAGGHMCIKEHLECPNKSAILQHSAKVLISDFNLCPHSKPHLHNCLIDLQDFLTQTAQGRRHTTSKIKSWIWWTHF